jgi:hypothetical protein
VLDQLIAHLQIKFLCLLIVLIYSAVGLYFGLATGVLTTGRGKFRRDANARNFWSLMALRVITGGIAAYFLIMWW